MSIHFCPKNKTKNMTSFLVLSSFLGITLVSTNCDIDHSNCKRTVCGEHGGPDNDEVSSRIIGTFLRPDLLINTISQ